MADHAAREHAVWSASSTARNWACPGAMALTMDLPESSNSAADWGTACHQLSERCLRDGSDATDHLGTIETGKSESFEVDDEMAETAQTYINFVRSHVTDPANLHIEQRFSLASLNPPFEAGGTADAVIWSPAERLLHVVDLKGGRGVVVEATNNPQLRTYALGAMLANPDWKAARIRVTIVQPRAAHRDGRIRSEEFHVVDLLEWTVDLGAAMRRAAEALIQRNYAEQSPATWAIEYLNAGSHCKFCRAAGLCPALERKAMDAAGVWFDNQDKPRLANTPQPTAPDARRDRLDLLDVIEDWIKSVRAYEHQQAEAGDLPTDYILVESFGREKFKDESAVIAKLKTAGVPDTLYLNPAKARTPKQIRDELAKKKNGMADKIALLADTTTTPSNGRTLVRADKTTRLAVTPTATTFFSDHGEATPSTGLFD